MLKLCFEHWFDLWEVKSLTGYIWNGLADVVNLDLRFGYWAANGHIWCLNWTKLCLWSFLSQTTSRLSSDETRGRRTASSRRRTCTGRSPSSSRRRRTSTRTSQRRWRSACRCAASPTRWRASRSASPTCPTTRVSGKGQGSTWVDSRCHCKEKRVHEDLIKSFVFHCQILIR